MEKLKVVKVNSYSIVFDNDVVLTSEHDQDCCEEHYLSMSDLSMSDFEGLEFDLTNDNFFKRIEGYGIELVPITGYSVKIPGYASNNGYYSSDLSLVLMSPSLPDKVYDISECQDY